MAKSGTHGRRAHFYGYSRSHRRAPTLGHPVGRGLEGLDIGENFSFQAHVLSGWFAGGKGN